MDLAKALEEFRAELESLNAAILRLENLRRAKFRRGRSKAGKPGKAPPARTIRGGRRAAKRSA